MQTQRNRRFHLIYISLFLIGSHSYADKVVYNESNLFTNNDHLTISSSGSFRLQSLIFDEYNNTNDALKYRRDGYNSFSKISLGSDYKFSNDLHFLIGSETYINYPKILRWHGRYNKSDSTLTANQLYVGIKNDQFGTLKFGKINDLFYDVVGVKTDLADYTPIAQPLDFSNQSAFDGTGAANRTLRYEKSYKKLDFYSAYLFKDTNTSDAQSTFKRNYGLQFATEYHFTPNFSWANAYQYNSGKLNNNTSNEQKKYNGHLIGSSLFYIDNHWLISLGVNYTKNLLPTHSNITQTAYNSETFGLESYAGYKFDIHQYAIENIRPYILETHFKYINGRNFKQNNVGIGTAIKFKYGLGLDVEHYFTSDTVNTPDLTLLRLRFDY
ncbi:hypothetical protein P256_00453 [Acinetobacter nectaris CIP 110549]|uniref:Porin domain-containing protein n=1 Tax=Acinetobacter nectaris CIP 110549 TaxID=1392540 RepID=V2UXG1_9GAMM|nr:hypothetical protein [Acinetobacter nectaris]ESK40014.1 hypothetical protein P256_00453 [Acinetobacter nectaris CIP 110549]